MSLRALGFALLLGLTVLLSAACSDDSPKSDSGPDAADAGPDGDGGGDAAPPPKNISIPGLGAPVEAVYDQHGILHLRCKSDDDCMAALGYFHAANRFFFMDFARTLMLGQLSEISIAGQLALDRDFATRHLMSTPDGTPLVDASLAKLSAGTKTLLDRYAAGVNAWLADLAAGRNGAKKSDEYGLVILDQKRVIPQWSAKDTLAVGLFLINDLGNSSDAELTGADIAASVSDSKLVSDLLTPRPVFQEFITTGAGIPFSFGGKPPLLALEHLRRAKSAIRSARAYLAPLARRPLGEGSNNWLVSKTLSANGRALLANDPHLTFYNPAIFFPVEIDATSDGGTGTLHCGGGTVPGMPFVFVGRNESMAWGVTTAYYDLNELYIEKLSDDGSAVIFNGQQVKLIQKELTFKDASSGQDVKKTFEWVPHHGPLISKDTASKTGVSMRWVAADGVTDPDAFFELMRAKKVADVPKALEKLTATNQNFIIADSEGNVGWFPYAKIPQRAWASTTLPPYLPVPGDGTAEWNGFVPLADLPQTQDPPNGFVVTANNANTSAVADGDATNDGKASVPYQALSKAIGARALRITQMIKDGGDKHDMASMGVIQGDTKSVIGELVVPALTAATQGQTLGAGAKKVMDAIAAWKFTCPTGLSSSDPKSAKSSDAAEVTDAIGCTAFHVTLAKIIVLALADEAKAAGIEIPGRARLNLVLTAIAEPTRIQSTFWDDVSTSGTTETRDEILRKALAEAATELDKINSDPNEWLWGRVHTVTLASPLDAFGVTFFNYGPYASAGALGTVNVAAPTVFRDEAFSAVTKLPLDQQHGASIRIIAEAGGGEVKMKLQLPGGTEHDPKSKRYNQLLEDWLANKSLDFPFGAGAVTSPDETLQVKPAQ